MLACWPAGYTGYTRTLCVVLQLQMQCKPLLQLKGPRSRQSGPLRRFLSSLMEEAGSERGCYCCKRLFLLGSEAVDAKLDPKESMLCYGGYSSCCDWLELEDTALKTSRLRRGRGVLPFGRQLLTANQSAGTAVIDHVKLSLSNYRACITSM